MSLAFLFHYLLLALYIYIYIYIYISLSHTLHQKSYVFLYFLDHIKGVLHELRI